MHGWKEILDSLLGDLAYVESLVAFGGEAVRVEGNKRVLSPMLLEGVVEGQKARKIGCVSYKGGPYCNFVLEGRQANPWALHMYLSSIPQLAYY